MEMKNVIFRKIGNFAFLSFFLSWTIIISQPVYSTNLNTDVNLEVKTTVNQDVKKVAKKDPVVVDKKSLKGKVPAQVVKRFWWDWDSEKNLYAEYLGIENYKGTVEQNMRIMQYIMDNMRLPLPSEDDDFVEEETKIEEEETVVEEKCAEIEQKNEEKEEIKTEDVKEEKNESEDEIKEVVEEESVNVEQEKETTQEEQFKSVDTNNEEENKEVEEKKEIEYAPVKNYYTQEELDAYRWAYDWWLLSLKDIENSGLYKEVTTEDRNRMISSFTGNLFGNTEKLLNDVSLHQETRKDTLLLFHKWYSIIEEGEKQLREAVVEEPVKEEKVEEVELWKEWEFKWNYKGVLFHAGFNEADYKQKLIQYAYKLGGMDFVYMLECENGNRDIHAIGDGWHAYGLCQMNDRFHKDIPSNYFDDWIVQIEYCYQKWKSGTVFYWPSRMIKWKKCYKYVEDRFTILG